jgi:hypothetical protein
VLFADGPALKGPALMVHLPAAINHITHAASRSVKSTDSGSRMAGVLEILSIFDGPHPAVGRVPQQEAVDLHRWGWTLRARTATSASGPQAAQWPFPASWQCGKPVAAAAAAAAQTRPRQLQIPIAMAVTAAAAAQLQLPPSSAV